MWNTEVEAYWQKLAEEVFTGMKEWRLQHPKATLKEIEEALDEGLARLRTHMLQDVALASAATKVSGAREEDKLKCPQCGHALQVRGQKRRTLTTNYNQSITLERSYTVCPACGASFFPPG